MARLYYDLWCLIEKGIAEQATGDSGLFERVAAHREIFFGQNWVDYATLRPGSLRVLPLADQLPSWAPFHFNKFKSRDSWTRYDPGYPCHKILPRGLTLVLRGG
ncbi:MAG: hypothetical protein ACRD63_04445 [Pyrinomonadaceae bacterium]